MVNTFVFFLQLLIRVLSSLVRKISATRSVIFQHMDQQFTVVPSTVLASSSPAAPCSTAVSACVDVCTASVIWWQIALTLPDGGLLTQG